MKAVYVNTTEVRSYVVEHQTNILANIHQPKVTMMVTSCVSQNGPRWHLLLLLLFLFVCFPC